MPDRRRTVQRRWYQTPAFGYTLFVAAIYVPILRMDRGAVEADTKSYLYLDVSRLLGRVGSLWDPHIALGTLSHQTIGYLFPMGPYYWFTEVALRIPPWIAQRLWLGTIIVFAGFGMRYLMRALGVTDIGVAVAMVAYAFSPYVLGYAGIYSALLLPWAALPWWLGFARRAPRRGGWKYPALFALTIQVVGSVNGSALMFALLGPALWLVYAVCTRIESLRAVWSVVWRTGALTIATSLWWFVALVVEGSAGSVNILRFTESVEAIAMTSLPFEVLRGLGNWYFYGTDRFGTWIAARPDFTQSVPILFASFLVPGFAIVAATLLRWGQRAFFVLLTIVGVVISVGAAPYADPSPVGRVYKSFALHSNLGLAFRNTGRALPLVAVSSAVLLGVGVSAARHHFAATGRAEIGRALAAGTLIVCLLTALPAIAGRYYAPALERRAIPQYWKQALRDLDAAPRDTRVLALPGSTFAVYRWGVTQDPIEPGLMDRPYVARELVAWGTPPSIDLLRALDRRVQEETLDPAALAPIARLMGVGDVLLRSDLQTDRYSLVPAVDLWTELGATTPPGFDPPVAYGTTIPGSLRFPPGFDPTQPPSADAQPPPVAVLRVQDARPIVRTAPTTGAVVVDGSGEGVVDAAGAGLVDGRRAILYSAPFESKPADLRRAAPDALLVVTDSNRKRASWWFQLRSLYGYTERAGQKPLVENATDQRLEVFPGTTDRTKSVSELRDITALDATTYGEPTFGYTPQERPAAAFDGDVRTAWTVDRGRDIGKERLVITLARPVTTDHLELVQYAGRLPGQAPLNMTRWITRVRLRFDDGTSVTRTLGKVSRSDAGQRVEFPQRTFTRLELVIDGVRDPHRAAGITKNAVGFSEIGIDGADGRPIRASETIRLPEDLLAAYGNDSLQHPLAIVVASDPQDDLAMSRTFTLPTAREFDVSGTVAIHRSRTTDVAIDEALGLPAPDTGGVTAESQLRTFDQPEARASSALDGDPSTAWNTSFEKKLAAMTVTFPEVRTVDSLDLQTVADGRHSLVTELTLVGDDGTTRRVPVRGVKPKVDGNVQHLPVRFAPIRTSRLRVQISGVYPVSQGESLPGPLGIAELGIAGVRRAPVFAELPATCRTDLLGVDGRPVGVIVRGTSDDAVRSKPLKVELCGNAPLRLAAGTHTITGAMAPRSGQAFDFQRLVLTSAAGGRAAPVSALTSATPPTGPKIRVTNDGATKITARVDPSAAPYWLTLGQSNNDGWRARLNGNDLGRPIVIDGYANGWRVDAPTGGTITFEWTPQRSIAVALVMSTIAMLVCVGIIVVALRRDRRRGAALDTASTEDAATIALDPPGGIVAPGPAVVVAVATGVVAALFADVRVGLLVAVALLVAARSLRARSLVRLVPGAIVVSLAVLIPLVQVAQRYAARFDWPQRYSWARLPTWFALMLLAGNIALERVAARSSPRAAPLPSDDPVVSPEDAIVADAPAPA